MSVSPFPICATCGGTIINGGDAIESTDGKTFCDEDCFNPHVIEQLQSENDKLRARVLRMEASLSENQNKLEHQRYWYGCRFERLRQFANEELPEPLRMRYFSITANGTAESAEPPTYAQQFNTLKHRYERWAQWAEQAWDDKAQLSTALKNLIDALERVRKADDAVERNFGPRGIETLPAAFMNGEESQRENADWIELENAIADLTIRENEARALLQTAAEIQIKEKTNVETQ